MIPDPIHAAVRTAYVQMAGRAEPHTLAVLATHLLRRAVSVPDARAVIEELRAADRAEQEARRLQALPEARRATITIPAGTTPRRCALRYGRPFSRETSARL